MSTADHGYSAFRGRIIFPKVDAQGQVSLVDISDGAVICDKAGRMIEIGPWTEIKNSVEAARHWRHGVILPGFIDTHLHFPQTDMIGSFGKDLLGWLSCYTFPEEAKFSDLSHAERVAVRFIDSLCRSGTTSFAAFSSSHRRATEALFRECQRRGARATIGLVSMDRNAPDEVLTKDLAQHERDLIDLKSDWHKGSLRLALTPRFAPSCSDDLMGLLGRMASMWQDTIIQTHYAECESEIKWIKTLYPNIKDYLAVYEQFGLLSPRTILTHAIHISDDEIDRMEAAGVKVAHCPSSNLFLGSGVMPIAKLRSKVTVGLGTDVGAGTSFSHWQTMADGYKSHRLGGTTVTAGELLWMATAGAAKAISLDHETGSFEIGKFCDLQIVDPTRAPLLKSRLSEQNMTASELIFSLMWHWQPDMQLATCVGGKVVYED